MSDLAILRRTIARELETISAYEEAAEAAQDPRVRQLLGHLAAEEKEHVAEGMAMLELFDARQAELAGHPPHFLEGAVPAAASAPAPAPGAAGNSEPVAALFRPGEHFTVGSLRRDRRGR